MCLGSVGCGHKNSHPCKEHCVPGSDDIETLITHKAELSSTMSEDVTYATLTFQDFVSAGNNQDRNNLRKRGKSSEMARCDLGGWTGVRYPEVLALTLMLFERSAVEFSKWRQSWRNFWYSGVLYIEEDMCGFQDFLKLGDIAVCHQALCYNELFQLKMREIEFGD